MIAIEINGERYEEHKSASVSLGIESFARSFTFDFSDKWLRTLVQDLPFKEGDPCKVSIDGEQVIDGFIDDVPIDYTATTHSIAVSGRSWTGHLVDCSAIHASGSWRNASLNTIGTDLCKNYDINFLSVDARVLTAATQPFQRYAIESGESVFECLQRAAKRRGVFMLSDAFRSVLVTKAGMIVHGDTLDLGRNILTASRTSRFSDRYSAYLIKGQRAGSDAVFGALATGQFFKIPDPQVSSFRPLMIINDGADAQSLQMRGTWERNLRAGRSRRVQYTVQGHRSATGQLWPLNQLVAVNDPFLGVRDNLLIVAVTYSQAPKVTTLELGRPEAFDVLAPPPAKVRVKGALH